MRKQPDRERVSAAEAARIRRRFPSYGQLVDDALFHPAWGYYSAGAVRFGEGGHYDTYPLALSPLFGRMVAEYAERLWRRWKRPARFELCELGAGNGQLCLDALLWILERGRHESRWQRFAGALRYRIIERSAALIERQRRRLGPMVDGVRWTRGDPARRPLRTTPFASHGLIVANEVLDCLAHEKVVPQRDGDPTVAYVVPTAGRRAIGRAELAALLSRPRRPLLGFRELLLPVNSVPGLDVFLQRHYPEFFTARRAYPVYFASPRVGLLLHNCARFYAHGEALWIDYGDTRAFHLTAPEQRKVFAGAPRSGAGVFDDLGRDDITFMVDFSVVARAAEDAGWRVVFYGPQAALAQRARIRLDDSAVDLIVRHRALNWMLALVGAHPEHTWRRGAVTWAHGGAAGRVPVRRYVERSVSAFLAQRGSPFRLLITRMGPERR